MWRQAFRINSWWAKGEGRRRRGGEEKGQSRSSLFYPFSVAPFTQLLPRSLPPRAPSRSSFTRQAKRALEAVHSPTHLTSIPRFVQIVQ